MKISSILVLALSAVGAVDADVKTTVFASGFSRPVFIADDPAKNGDRKFVVEQGGLIKIFESGQILSNPFLDLSDVVTFDVADGFEEGLLGLAFDPKYKQNGYFYVNYTARRSRPGNKIKTVIRRITATGDVASPGEEEAETILEYDQPTQFHNGGHLAFGPDDMLYISSGDGGAQGDPNNNGQSLDTLLGKILRIDVRNFPGGNIMPVDNPFPDNPFPDRSAIWLYGLRNPWRFSFDEDGNMFIGDVGQTGQEEIDLFLLGGSGRNFGWSIMEGDECFHPKRNCNREGIAVESPIITYDNDPSVCAVTGGYRYRGRSIPELKGKYIYGDYCGGQIWVATLNPGDGSWSTELLLQTEFLISSFGEASNGELYVLSYITGQILLLEAAD